jgi:hypothetical protein
MHTHTRTGNHGQPLTSIEAAHLAVKMGWTVKEAAWETGWGIRKFYKMASEQGFQFAYGGQGPKPGWVHPSKGKARK